MNISATANSTSGSHSLAAGIWKLGSVSARWIGPISATPRSCSQPEAAMLATITTSAPGTDRKRSLRNRRTSAATPQPKLAICQLPTLLRISYSSGTNAP